MPAGRREEARLLCCQGKPGHRVGRHGGALPGPGAGAEALIELAARYGVNRVDRVPEAWLDRRGLGNPA